MEEFEEFMAEMLEEYNYDKDTVMVTTAFTQTLASEWCKKQLLLCGVSNRRELLLAFVDYYCTLEGVNYLPEPPEKMVDDFIANNCC